MWRIDETTWQYDAFNEPQSETCPGQVRVWIAAVQGGVELARTSIVVRPVHRWLTTGHKHGPGAPMDTGSDTEHFMMNYEFIRWKYAGVLNAIGGGFSSVTISSDLVVLCPPIPLIGEPAYACTNSVTNSVVFGRSTFLGSENKAASLIGHELTHTTGANECQAYTWEANNAIETGLSCDEDYFNETLDKWRQKCNMPPP